MKRCRLLLVALAVGIWLLPQRVYATGSDVLISEVQTGSSSSASEEFIELVNVTDHDVALGNWQLQYFSAGSANFDHPSRTIALHGTIAVGAYHVAASNNYLTTIASDFYSATLAQAGGHVRLVTTDTGTPIQRDLLGWGTATSPEAAAATPAEGGSSMMRQSDSSGSLIDTDNNASDFVLSTSPTPGADNVGSNPGGQGSGDQGGSSGTNVAPLQITELLPNPAPPATDSNDEFVELYNPTAGDVNLSGYKLLTGSNLSYSYTFGSEILPTHAYHAYFVTQTKATLANSGGKAQLLGPDGSVVDETAVYDTASDGEAWALVADQWQWTATPTPGSPNVADDQSPDNSVSVTSTGSKAKTSTSKSKNATTKTASVKGASTSKGSSNIPADSGSTQGTQPATLHPAILAGIGGLALVYGAYEYRHDLANKLYQLRRFRANRRAARQESSRR